MKFMRNFATILLLCCIMLFSGCDKVWSVDFTKAYDVNDWYIFSFGGGPGSNHLYKEGLMLDYYGAVGPYGFGGDFTMTVSFSLNVNDITPAETVWIITSDGSGLYTMEHIALYLFNLGNDATDSLEMKEIYGGDWKTIATRDSIPGLRKHGTNTYKLVKNGDRIKAYFNGTLICDHLLEHYDLVYSFPVIYSRQGGSTRCLFTDVKFSHSGMYIPRP